MSKHSIRVVLHGADSEDYKNLRSMLDNIGIRDTIVGTDNKTYLLPPGEYHVTDYRSAEDIRDIVRAVANKTGRSNAVTVGDGNTIAWIGLEELNIGHSHMYR